MKKTWEKKKNQFYFFSVLTISTSKIYMVDNINGVKYMGKGIKLRNVHILKKSTHFEKVYKYIK